ncbi:hypothetical protein DYU11_18470 [Fibrisoma montanum]|uniref:Uncharacterized protein n=1 Tax=Fibrisoma montanum TaxID=2305895 RepID=A0A418M6D5_9BACT|nr:hypothetical protein [Fibrisoma montanum]RIV21391.1 hypothetical protein DYU11_18470 [Fibrisoma montanum]
MPASFNSEQYQYSDVSVQIGDRVLVGLRGVKYMSEQEKEPVYGKGNQPLAIQRGNKKYEGEIKILQGELELLIDKAPNKDIIDYRNLTITVAYSNGAGLTTDNLVGVEFKQSPKEMNQNDKFMEVTLPILFLKLKQGV